MNREDRHRGFKDSLDGIWNKECILLDQIFDQGIALEPKQLMQFHDYVYHHCSSFVHNSGVRAQDPGKHLHESLTRYLTTRLREMAAEMETITESEQLLIVYAGRWQPYQKACADLDLMCRYFNVNWVKRERQVGHSNIHEVYPMAMHLWMELVFRPIDRSLVDAIVRQKKYAASLVYQVLQSLVQLYANDVRQETTVRDKLINIFGMESGVLQFYEKQTTEWFKQILATKKYSALKPFLKYVCLAMPEIEDGQKFKEFLKSHIAPQLRDALARSPGGKNYVQAILGLRHGPLERGLREHKKLLYVIDEVCETAINSSEINHKITSTELLVRYTHQLMTTKHSLEEEPKDELKRIVEVVEFIFNKDVFLNRYRSSLQNRQINETSTSDDLEVTMVSLLAKRFGRDATTNLSKQLKEMQKSDIIKDQFNAYLIGRDIKLEFDFRLKCFNASDITQNISLIYPSELQGIIGNFKAFFLDKYKGRKLEFNIQKSSAEIVVNIDRSSPYFVKVSVLQMALLLQYNQNDKYTVEELAVRLGTEIDTIIPVSLERILVCGESLTPSSSVEVAREFSKRKRHLNINTVPTKQRKIEYDDQELRQRRTIQVRCVVVRIMKKRMIINHAQLMGEVSEELRNHFKPDTKLIKREIEYLIERNFLERSENNSYTYIC
ncbi:hypothetical protein KR054_006674 [Drosophila jambulina]|nr:hypothetical protein KR054_006674 [Drosophila jambulina]